MYEEEKEPTMLKGSSCCPAACPGQHRSLGWLTPAVRSQIPTSFLGLSRRSKALELEKKRKEATLRKRRPHSGTAPAQGTYQLCNSEDVLCAAFLSLLVEWSSIEGVLEVSVCREAEVCAFTPKRQVSRNL